MEKPRPGGAFPYPEAFYKQLPTLVAGVEQAETRRWYA